MAKNGTLGRVSMYSDKATHSLNWSSLLSGPSFALVNVAKPDRQRDGPFY